MTPLSPLRLTVLVSGGGTTLRNLLERIADHTLDARVDLVISSTRRAGALNIAHDARVPTVVVAPQNFADAQSFSLATFDACRHAGSHLVVMGGYLKHVDIPADYSARVLNIHPALIPAFSGAGMYGGHVHRAVLEAGAKLSGCTVHFVDNEYDHGPIVLQQAVPVLDDDTPETLAARVFAAECSAYPEALRLFAAGRLHIDGRRVRVQPPT